MKKVVHARMHRESFLESSQQYVKRHFKIIAIVALLVVIFISAYFVFFYKPSACTTPECFLTAMQSCSKKSYVNDAPEASWEYQIKGVENGQCKVNVKLLLAKQGELGIDKLIGLDMDCYYPSGISTYPEKDLNNCHGLLKEELQNIIINKLHSYIIENLGQIKTELTKIST